MIIQNKELQKRLKKYNDYQMLTLDNLEEIMLNNTVTEEYTTDNNKEFTFKHIIFTSLILSAIFAVALVIGVVFFFRYLS